MGFGAFASSFEEPSCGSKELLLYYEDYVRSVANEALTSSTYLYTLICRAVIAAGF